MPKFLHIATLKELKFLSKQMLKTKLQEEKYQWRKSLESFQSLAPNFLQNKILSECYEKIEEDLFFCQKKDSGSNQKGNFVNR